MKAALSADVRFQRRHQHQRRAHQLGVMRSRSGSSKQPQWSLKPRSIGQQTHALQKVMRNHGPENIELSYPTHHQN
jgi:hypothetical protein